MKQFVTGFLASLLLISSAGCGTKNDGSVSKENSKEVAEMAGGVYRIPMVNQERNTVGYIEVYESKEKGVDIHLSASELPPGTLAFHIFEKAECTGPTFESAGSVFNPTNKEHGFDNPKGPYAGDLPNIEVGADGKVDIIVNAPDVTISQGKLSLLDNDGSAFIIHSGQDDYLTNPSGNSGERIVCGSIKNGEAQ
ncbi:superoxide dismutase family protein [Bacillus gobiensis]|uniref:superoxide dismutase family protein n=1 Tax=Bacillus gobiensis TaxID=1441095 RepID=UPI003D1F370B